MEFRAIGTIQSPFAEPEGMPIQPAGAAGVEGTVTLLEPYRDGLKDLDGFSHIILIYQFHRAGPATLEVVPFLDGATHGIFATRAPRRPNPIGLSVVRLLGIEAGVLRVVDVDILDGTPLLDIKPYVPAFDAPGEVRTGWLEHTAGAVRTHRSDDRFR